MATKTTWLDKNNDQHEGWIIDGKTYTDEAGTTRVPIGATVNTAGGTFKLTSNGGIPTYQTAKTQYQSAAQAALNAYKAASGAQEKSIQYSTDAAIAELKRQKGIAQQNRETANREAYHAYLAASNPYGAAAEQRAKIGLANSGYAETSQMKLAGAYAGQLSENVRAMNAQLQELDVQIAQAKATGQYEIANILEARAQNILQQEIALQNNIFSGDMQAMGQAESTRQFDEQMAENTRQFDTQLQAQKEQAEQQNKWDLALAFIENGKNASFISEVLGIPQADVNTLIAAVNAQRTASRSSSGGGGSKKSNSSSGSSGGKSYVDTMLALGSEAAVQEWLIRNNFSESEKEILLDMYDEALDAQGTKTVTYQHVLDVIGGMYRRGKASKEAITAYINSLEEGTLTDEELDAIIDKYGL
ncbi:MAG: hypothetical protein E7441_05795 [Ruminococcaceae bacterium]|nr:hypothetical protein [Oscillospiraceae bacterium]